MKDVATVHFQAASLDDAFFKSLSQMGVAGRHLGINCLGVLGHQSGCSLSCDVFHSLRSGALFEEPIYDILMYDSGRKTILGCFVMNPTVESCLCRLGVAVPGFC